MMNKMRRNAGTALFCLAALLAGCTRPTSVSQEPAANPPAQSAPRSSEAQAADGVQGNIEGPVIELDDLNKIAEAQIPGIEGPLLFENNLVYDRGETFEVFRTTGIMGVNTILVREKGNGEWHGVDLGEYANQGVRAVFGMPDDPAGIELNVDGQWFGGDYRFQDFPRTLRYGLDDGKVTVTQYASRFAEGSFGCLGNRERVRFAGCAASGAQAVFDFAVTGEGTGNGYRCPEIQLSRQHVFTQDGAKEGDIYTIRFLNTENNLTPEQLAQLKTLPGVTDVQAAAFDAGGLRGTALQIAADWPQVLEYAFVLDQAQADPFIGFTVTSVNDPDLI